MTSVEFPEVNTVFAKDQPEYQALHACVSGHPDGCTAFCYRLTFWERIKLLFTGRLWFEQLTFHQPFQPVRPAVNKPDWSTYGKEE